MNETKAVDVRNGSLLPRETRNSLFFKNKTVLLGSVIQYNAEKLIQEEVAKNIEKVSFDFVRNVPFL